MSWKRLKEVVRSEYWSGRLQDVSISVYDVNKDHVLIFLESYDLTEGKGEIISRFVYDVNDSRLYVYAEY